MSSDIQHIVEELQMKNYVSLMIATAVVYDYIITFPKEIKYIWNRSWTFVSAMFILVRYVGLNFALEDIPNDGRSVTGLNFSASNRIYGLYGSTFVPGPTSVSTVLLFITIWEFIIFLAAADIVMILRVYAMYNKSKIVLGVLLVLYATTIILYAISAGDYNKPHALLMTNPRVLNMSFCNPTYRGSSKLGVHKLIPRLILAALMFILAVARFCVESFQTYKATKQWQVNRYLNLLVKEGILYFLVHLLYNIDFGRYVTGFMMDMFSFILMFILSPRFIMNVRELHLRNVTFGRGMGLDSGFGLSSRVPGVPLVGFADSVTTEGDVETGLVGSGTGSAQQAAEGDGGMRGLEER